MQCGFPDELRLVCSDIRSVNATDMYCGQGRRILAATSRSRRTVCATCKSEARIDGWPSPGRCASPLASGHQARTVPPRGPFPATHLHRTHLHRTWGWVAGRGFAARTGCRCAVCLHCAAHRPDPALAVCLHCAAGTRGQVCPSGGTRGQVRPSGATHGQVSPSRILEAERKAWTAGARSPNWSMTAGARMGISARSREAREAEKPRLGRQAEQGCHREERPERKERGRLPEPAIIARREAEVSG